MNGTLIRWLIERLDAEGWSQRELARRAGVSQTTVSQVIAGQRAPTPDFCLQVATALREPPELLLRLAGHLPARATSDDLDPQTRHRLQEVARKLALLDDNERARITRQYLTQLDFALSLKGVTIQEEEQPGG